MPFPLKMIVAIIVLAMATPCFSQSVGGKGQLIISITDTWSDDNSTVYMFQRKGGIWQRVGDGMAAVVGGSGLGWDPTASDRGPGEPIKKEGDRRAPAGIFPITLAMGFKPILPVGMLFPYRQIIEGTHCVDDTSSPYYNRIVREDSIPKVDRGSWKSSERMWTMEEVYRLLLVVGYNTVRPKPGDGSCIFVHVRRTSGVPTYGCTALTETDLSRIVKWLRPEDRPALVQFPRDVYRRVWLKWGLPSPYQLERVDVKRSFPLVNVLSVAPDVVLDMRYAGSNNFTGRRIYDCGSCYLRPETAAKVAKAQAELKKQGLSLKMWDCYRPLSAQRLFWSLVPDPRFVADPKTGSRHNRGNSVDVTLVDSSGKELEMATGFDDFSSKAAHGANGISAKAAANRRLLRETMERAGFRRLESEWWHYDDTESNREIIDVPFSELCR